MTSRFARAMAFYPLFGTDQFVFYVTPIAGAANNEASYNPTQAAEAGSLCPAVR